LVQVNNNNNNQFLVYKRAGLTPDMKKYLLAELYNLVSLLLHSLEWRRE